MKTVNITVKKKTLLEVYNQVSLLNNMGFPNFQKDEPINKLMREIKRDIMKQKKVEKVGWKDVLEFWPMSIVVPGMLLLILWGSTQ
jgi:dihydroorotate dehydrogenase